MDSTSSTLAARLEERFADAIAGCVERDGEVTCEVVAEELLSVCRILRDAPEFAFEQLIDVCGVDYSAYGNTDWETSETATTGGFSRGVTQGEFREQDWSGPRFAAVYHLLSVSRNERLRLRVMLDGDLAFADRLPLRNEPE